LVFDEVFTYGIGATWTTNFAHLGRMAGNNGDWCGRGGSAQARRQWQRAAPAKPRAPAWELASGKTPGVVDLARAAAHQCGGELHTAARVLTIAEQNSP
jgi:hypothetical protein